MGTLKFNKEKIENLIQKSFPKAKIEKYEQFSTGLVNPTFKVNIINPSKTIVVKLGKLKNKDNIHKNNKILNYLNNHKISTPKIFFNDTINQKVITIMDYIPGDTAGNIYKNTKLRKNILFYAGENLKKIHKLKIPSFWIHQHHEITNQKKWKQWTSLRIKKYLEFFNKKMNNDFTFLETELNEFWEILKNEKIDFVPLHWDYHLSNLNADSKGKITGTFDFDNAMKGHSLADIGQTAYWIRFELNETKNFKYFLKGYKRHFTKKELKLVKGYFILHILAVSRSLWFKKKRLGWILDRHTEMIRELQKN